MTDRLEAVDLKKIKITDALFGEYARLVSEKIIPYQWKILNDEIEGAEPTYCIQNFRIAAGEASGERKGVVFEDSDLYKWIEAASYALANGSGDAFRQDLSDVIALLGRAQEEDGYLNTYFSVAHKGKRFTNLLEGHELYCAGHLIEAAVAYTKATGEQTLLTIARKYADLICRTFGKEEGQIPGYPGHQEIELALVKLFRLTGEEKYLKTANYFIEERGTSPSYFEKERASRQHRPEFFPEFANLDLNYMQADKPPVQQEKAEGHAVRAVYMYSAMADLALEYGDPELMKACTRLWDNLTQKQMYLTGSIGSSGFLERFTTDFDLPNQSNYSETCASIGLMMFGQRMCNATKQASYYDIVERALYNTVLAGVSQSGDRYFYVNPLEVVPEFCIEHTALSHVKPVRQKWFSVACCPPNVARTLASLGQYIYAKDQKNIYIQQFISSEMTEEVGDSKVRIQMDSSLMQNGTVRLQVEETKRKVPILIRVPGYAGEADVEIDGQRRFFPVQNGYLCFTPEQDKTELLIDFQIKPRWMSARDEVRADAGKVALMYGPCVYCLEEKDNEKLLSGIYADPKRGAKLESTDRALFGKLPCISYQGVRVHNRLQGQKLYDSPKFVRKEVELKAIPYCLWGNRGEGEMLVWQKAILWG